MYSYKKPISLKERIKGTLINIENILTKKSIEYSSIFENYYNGSCGNKINEEKSLHVKTYNLKNHEVSKMEIHLYSDNQLSIKIFKNNNSYHSFKFERDDFKKRFKNFMKEIELNDSDIFHSLSKSFTIYPEHKNIIIDSIKKQLKKELSPFIPVKKEHDLNSQQLENEIANKTEYINKNIESLPAYEQKKILESQIEQLTLQLKAVNKQIFDEREKQFQETIVPLKNKKSIIDQLKSKVDSQFYNVFKQMTKQLNDQEKIEIMEYINIELLTNTKKNKARRDI